MIRVQSLELRCSKGVGSSVGSANTRVYIMERKFERYIIAGLTAAGIAASVYGGREIRRLRDELSAVKPAQKKHSPSRSALLAAVELGGTTCLCAISYYDTPTELVDACEIPTREPQITLRKVIQFLDRHSPFVALGVASFGPVVLNPQSSHYGYITNTPKVRWRQLALLKHFEKYNVPTQLDTDANAAALAEYRVGGHG